MAEMLIPRNRDGSGWTRLSCSDGAAAYLRLQELAGKVGCLPLRRLDVPADASDFRKRRGSLYYRCRIRGAGWEDERYVPRFSLDFGHPKSTLLVLADHWNACGIDWISIQDVTNKRWNIQRADVVSAGSAA